MRIGSVIAERRPRRGRSRRRPGSSGGLTGSHPRPALEYAPQRVERLAALAVGDPGEPLAAPPVGE
jgi:hypothetical protein